MNFQHEYVQYYAFTYLFKIDPFDFILTKNKSYMLQLSKNNYF